MVKDRRALAAAAAVLALALVLLVRVVGDAPTPAAGAASGRGRAPRGAEDELPRIGLARLDGARGEANVGKRDLFEFGAAATRPNEGGEGPPSTIAAVVPTPPPEPPPPPLPALNLKYIGSLEDKRGLKVAVFLTDRKEILTGQVGEIVGNRFKVVKIGIESVDLQDVGTENVRRVPLKGN